MYGGLTDVPNCPAGIVDRFRHYFLTHKQSPDRPTRLVEIEEVYGRGTPTMPSGGATGTTSPTCLSCTGR